MKIIYFLLLFGILTILFSCNQINKKPKTYYESIDLVSNSERNINNNIATNNYVIKCIFDKLLKNSNTPKLAIELYNNTAKYFEEPLSYFGYLTNIDKETREFYFRVLTNSYKIADAALAEGLGNIGKEFIEENPKDFAIFFDNKDCFSDRDLNIQAKISLLEFEIIDENIELGNGDSMVDLFCKNLTMNSEHYTKN